MIHYYAFVCLLLCIKLYLCDSDIYVIVIFDMCALYFEVISLVLCSFALLPCFTPMQMSFITCTHAYFISLEYINVGLGHISLPNSFVLIDKSSSLSHTRGGIVINHQKGGD